VPPDGTAFKGHDDGGTMVAQFGWGQLLAALVIASAIAAISLSMSALPSLFDFAQAGSASQRLANRQHDPAAYNLLQTLDPLLR